MLTTSTTPGDLAQEVLKRLGDASETIWTEDEISDYIIEGSRALVIGTRMLWGVAVLPDWTGVFSYTAAWEIAFFSAGDLVAGPGTITAAFERDWSDNAGEPLNHTAYWESHDGWVETENIPALSQLPGDLHTIERSTWNTYRVDPLASRDVEEGDSRYELNTGLVDGYMRDKDGLTVLRKWRKPATAYTPWNDPDAQWGILRQLDDISAESVDGAWGIIRRIPGQESTDVFGEPHVYKEQHALRVEYMRRPDVPATDALFELPARYLKHIRHFAMARAFQRRGEGQNPKLAAHYSELWLSVLGRFSKRGEMTQKGSQLRGAVPAARRPPRPRLPWQYGSVVR